MTKAFSIDEANDIAACEWLNNKFNPPVEVEEKSYYPPVNNSLSFPEWLAQGGNGDLYAGTAIEYYTKIMPFFNAVDLRATTFSSIPVRVKEKQEGGEFLETHPVMDLLERPNANSSWISFSEQMSSFFDVTGDCYIMATGRINAPPLEMQVISPQHVTDSGIASGKMGFLNLPSYITVESEIGRPERFEPREYPGLGLRYVNREENRELWHFNTFNPKRSATNFRGMSRAQPIWYEMQQYLSGNKNNLANLKRGTRLSMAWVNNSGTPLTDGQWDRMQEEAAKYKGDSNAGGTPVLDGMDVKTIQQTNRDMEFGELQQSMYSKISTAYKIPLAFLLPGTMTMNNVENSMLQFFDLAALPLTNRIYNELTLLLMPRYQGSENLKFSFNQNDIPALRTRVLENAKKQKDVDASTINELRQKLGDEPLSDGGDEVYRPMGLVPVGEEDPIGDDDDEGLDGT